MKVLVVDDDPSISLVLETALEAWGYEVWHATNGQEALEQLQTGYPPAGEIANRSISPKSCGGDGANLSG